MRAYSTREAAELAGLAPQRVRGWARAGLLDPVKDANGHWRYSFQDIALLRTAAGLLRAELPAQRVTRSLRLIREQLPAGRPLSAVRIVINGRRVVVRDRLASWEPESRQGTLDFDMLALSAPVAAQVAAHARAESPGVAAETPAERESAQAWYEAALDLELAGRSDSACDAYAAALSREPEHVGARINLGRLLQLAGHAGEAERHYRHVLAREPDNVLATFNLGVALEEQERSEEAMAIYHRALALDECYADAHFNLSRLLEAKGDRRGALRHLSAFKRLLGGR